MARSEIKMWRFDDAPQEYQDLSRHGGDEDWLVLIPPHYLGEFMPWFEDGYQLNIGCCSVSTHVLSDGSEVRIGAHA